MRMTSTLPTEFCIAWDSYKNTVSKGFAHLQQNAEFVDMTLAAEGHLVKVHQNVVALASPYLKGMLQSASCHHPVIFLNNISHKTLEYILEYIYTGEVRVPKTGISVFIEACKALHICGVENFIVSKKLTEPDPPDLEQSDLHDLVNQRNNEPSLNYLTKDNQEFNTNLGPHSSDSTFIQMIGLPNNTIADHNINEIEMQQTDYEVVIDEIINNNSTAHIEPLNDIFGVSIDPSNNNATTFSETPKDITNAPIDINLTACTEQLYKNIVQSTVPEEPSANNFATNIVQFEENVFDTEPINNFAAHIIVNNNCLKVEPLQSKHSQAKINMVNQNEMEVENNSNNIIVLDDDRFANTCQNKRKKMKSIAKDNGNQSNNISMAPKQEKIISSILSSTKNEDIIQYYTVSNRGALQIILGRFMYSCHHRSLVACKRRWRCVDYRNLQCQAFIDSEGNKIINRLEVHAHPYHDSKIRSKIATEKVFTSILEAEEAAKS